MSAPITLAQSADLARTLLAGAKDRRWFRSKARPIAGARIVDVVALADPFALVLLGVDFESGPSETYVLPNDMTTQKDAVADPRFDAFLLDLMRNGTTLTGDQGELAGVAFAPISAGELPAKVGSAEQTNSAIIYGGQLLCKLFRAVEEGPNAEYEIGRFFATHGEPPRGVSRLVGAIEHRRPGREPSTIAVLFQFVPNRGDAWSVILGAVDDYLAGPSADPERLAPTLARQRLLGQRTAEMHLALARETTDPLFAPEPFDAAHQQAIWASAQALLANTFALLSAKLPALDADTRALGEEVLLGRARLEQSLAAILEPVTATRIRIHGDYHLGQVLDTGDDFVIIDFEGEPGRPLAERRWKLGPFRDVAGMIRSYEYAAAVGLRARAEPDDDKASWARTFANAAWNAFVAGYLERAQGTALIPPDAIHQSRLLDFYLIEKCVYEVAYELNNRPDWVAIPLAGLAARIGGSP